MSITVQPTEKFKAWLQAERPEAARVLAENPHTMQAEIHEDRVLLTFVGLREISCPDFDRMAHTDNAMMVLDHTPGEPLGFFTPDITA